MCENIDWNVGRMLRKLDELKLADNTIVLYFSDNGPNSWRWNGGMKGRKGSTDEGGVRVAVLHPLAGPHHGRAPRVRADRRRDRPAAHAGRAWPASRVVGDKPLDGASLTPLLLGTAERLARPHDLLALERQGQRAHAAVPPRRPAGSCSTWSPIPGQDHDIAGKQPEVAAKLAASRGRAGRKEVLPASGRTTGRSRSAIAQFPMTPLPARDGVPHGNVQRSASAPNCSYFTNWTQHRRPDHLGHRGAHGRASTRR